METKRNTEQKVWGPEDKVPMPWEVDTVLEKTERKIETVCDIAEDIVDCIVDLFSIWQ